MNDPGQLNERSRWAGAVRRVAYAASLAVILSIAVGFWLTVWIDRDGGVTLLLLRRAPAWEPQSSGGLPAQTGWILVRGNENGVSFEELVYWNARCGLAASSAVAVLVWLVSRRARR